MENNQNIINITKKYVTQNYGRYPIALVKGKGMQVWDQSGNKYLDFVAGVAVDNLGHCHPKIVKSIQNQAKQLIHVSNWFHIPQQSRLARELSRLSFGNKVFFCNSGTEAIEAAIKIARRFYFDQGFKNKYEIITTNRSFHGRTYGSLSATPQKKMQIGFGPMLKGFKNVPFDDVGALKKEISSKTCAIMLEPIQGETGVIVPGKNYLKEVRKLCTEKNILLIIDEIQTGFGRTGTLFAYQGFGIKPDIMTLAKGLGGGVPIGAMVTTNRIAKTFVPGTHGSTFGGNPLVCAAALASLEVISEKTFLPRAAKNGEYFYKKLVGLAKEIPSIEEVRGKGLIIGIDIKGSSLKAAQILLKKGFLVNSVVPNTLRFIPPLIVSKKEIDLLIKALEETLTQKEFTNS